MAITPTLVTPTSLRTTGKQWIDGTVKGFLPSGVLPKTRDGSDILIDSDVPQPPPTGFAGLVGPQHNPNLYAADLAKLVRFANDDNSPFAGTDAALALRSGTVYQGPPVAIAVGQPDTAELGALPTSASACDDGAGARPTAGGGA